MDAAVASSTEQKGPFCSGITMMFLHLLSFRIALEINCIQFIWWMEQNCSLSPQIWQNSPQIYRNWNFLPEKLLQCNDFLLQEQLCADHIKSCSWKMPQDNSLDWEPWIHDWITPQFSCMASGSPGYPLCLSHTSNRAIRAFLFLTGHVLQVSALKAVGSLNTRVWRRWMCFRALLSRK